MRTFGVLLLIVSVVACLGFHAYGWVWGAGLALVLIFGLGEPEPPRTPPVRVEGRVKVQRWWN